MAFQAGRLVLHVSTAIVGDAVAMHLFRGVAVQAAHAVAIVHIGAPAIVAGKFRIDPASVAEGAGLGFVFAHEFMPVHEAGIDAGHDRALDVTVAAGSVATSA